MATTALKVVKEGLAVRTKFMTVQNDGFLDVDIFHCDEKFKPLGKPTMGVCDGNEENYHKDLRIKAKAKGHFVPEQSTNPEWNPE